MKLDSSGLVGRHGTVTEAATPIVNAITKAGGRCSAGFITASRKPIRYAGRRVKAVEDGNSILLTILTKLGKQEIRVYGLKLDVVQTVLAGLKGYEIAK
ncbi:MAG: hypothetical protein E6P95_01195 [Candidatus Moraniibacteriota bacterium]|nr:MAG: hypothetical protein E6P95_01195 [Candidatus Moranbacteria bacterium]